MIDDLEKPLFTQSQVLRMLPDLKAKTLQNWASRGLLDAGDQKPGRQGRRLYTPLGVIMLNFMQQIVFLGIPPERADELANQLAEAALEFWRSVEIGRSDDDKSRRVLVSQDRLKSFRRARVVVFKSEDTACGYRSYLEFVDNLDDVADRYHFRIGIVVEVDFIILETINRMFQLEAGVI